MAGKGRQHYSSAPRRKTASSTLVLYGLILLSLLIVIVLAFGILSSSSNSKHKAHDLSLIAHDSLHARDGDEESKDQWVEDISWEPRASIFHHFLVILSLSYVSKVLASYLFRSVVYVRHALVNPGNSNPYTLQSKEECEYLISIAQPHMEKSTVVDTETGKSRDSRVRTSYGTFLTRGRDKIVQRIEKRIADFTFLPVEHGEGLQVLHYEPGQKYEPHYDYFLDEYNTQNGGQRIATVLMYLSDVEEGGETVFPAAKGNFSSVPYWNELSECGKGGLSVRPKMGDALLFWSMKPDATLDSSSLHAGCPVIKGNKWSSTKWIRVHEHKA
ncbi:hypothetical protein SASPL_108637 [Salvia splendens]|uniref:procollagen-proline 4-dioxygenase n=1 Tax=Salvia splendens TaxID=180675 RepID=A0A8X8YH22_SALSN|nr:hypothetical protein SASPL_108637 [Salvia splendens]